MKVAVVIERVEAWRGGAETSTLEFAHLLAAQGAEVHVLTTSRCPSPPDLQIHMVPVGAVFKPLRTQAFVRRAEALLRRERFDVVHAVAPLPGADVYQPRGGLVRETLARNVATRQSASRRWLKRVATALNVKQRTLLELEARVCRAGGPTIAAVSRYVARQLERHYGLSEPRVRVVFNGVWVDPVSTAERQRERQEIRRQYGLADEAVMVLCVAHNFRLKGVGRLIEALRRAAPDGSSPLHVVVVGRDNPVPFLSLAGRLGVADRVTFAGPTQRIRAFFHAADVCVHPTYYDPCSRVVLEALARGVPCVTTAFNGAAEAMEDGVHGFVIGSPDDVDALAERLVRLCDSGARAQMARAAAALAPRVSMARHVEEMMSLYRELVAARQS